MSRQRLRESVVKWSIKLTDESFALKILKLVELKGILNKAKFVEFESVYDPAQMKGQRYPVLNWPYNEGLRIDEAMHPLTTVSNWFYTVSHYPTKMELL